MLTRTYLNWLPLPAGEELIKPTRIYVRALLPALQRGAVKAVAHVTGGGLLENLPRVVPDRVRARLNAHWWNVHPVSVYIYSFHFFLRRICYYNM